MMDKGIPLNKLFKSCSKDLHDLHLFCYNLVYICEQASTLTQNDTGPVGPVTPSICWSCKIFTGPTFFL